MHPYGFRSMLSGERVEVEACCFVYKSFVLPELLKLLRSRAGNS